MKFSRSLIIFVLSFLALSSVAQENRTDSLRQVVLSARQDTARVNALIELAVTYRGSDPGELIRLAEEARDLAGKAGYRKGLANAYKWIGIGYSDQDIYIDATLNWQESLRIFEEAGDKSGIANILSNLGTIYSNQGDDEKALELYLRSLKMAQDISDKIRTLTASLNIGLIYQKKEATWDKALEYYFIALPLAEEMDYADGIGTACVNIGEVYFDQGRDSLALEYFLKSREALRGTVFLSYTLINIGKYYTRRGDFENAAEVQNEAFRIAEEQNS